VQCGYFFYVSVFLLLQQVTSADGSQRTFDAIRRYQDFDWLHQQLTNSFPGVIIPPLPDKSIVGRFNADFIDARRRGLHKFLMRVLTHRLLCKVRTPTNSQLSSFISMARSVGTCI
jgi:hypothetical protein